jgi:hypothetical protein
MNYVLERLTGITKNWSDIEVIYSDLKYIKTLIGDYILEGKDFFYVYDLVVSSISVIELDPDDFEGRIFRDCIKQLKSDLNLL